MTADERLFVLAFVALALLLGIIFWLVLLIGEMAELIRFLVYGQGSSSRRKEIAMKKRPAEISGAGGSVVLIVARLAGVTDPDALVAIGAIAGVIPAAVTFLRANGGIRGVFGSLWGGKR